MSQFADMLSQLEAKAAEEWSRAQAAGLLIEQKLITVAEDGFSKAVNDFGSLACSLSLKFMQDEFAVLSGTEKQGSVVTGLVQSAEAAGKTLLIQDAQALAKTSFLAVTSVLTTGK